jgi:hypothetical protein
MTALQSRQLTMLGLFYVKYNAKERDTAYKQGDKLAIL